MLQAVKEAVQHKVWGQASLHHLGAGLQAGVDMTIFKRVYKKLVQYGIHSTAGSLLSAVSGGIWTRVRLAEAMSDVHPMCPDCGFMRQDDFHLIWGCQCLETCSDPRIQNSNWILGDAWRGRKNRACFYLRRHTPKDWTARNLGAEECIHQVYHAHPLEDI